MRRRASDAGFTLTELMVVVVILGVLAALGGPRLARDRNEDAGSEFASEIARDIQRSRMEAITDRRPIRIFFYPDRVEIKRFKPGATAAAKFLPPLASPLEPEFLLRRISARPGIKVVDVLPAAAAPSAPSVSPGPLAATPETVDMGTLGNATFMVNVTPSVDLNSYIYIENTKLPAVHTERKMRIDVQFLTGFVQMRSGW